MSLDIDALNNVFKQFKGFRESFNLLNFFIQPHVMHVNPLLKNTCSDKKFHSHRTYEFSILLDGKVKFIFEDIEIDINSGDGFIIPPGVPHMWYAPEQSLVFNIMLFISWHGDRARRHIEGFNKSIINHNYTIRNFTEFEQNIRQIIDEAMNRQVGFDEKILCLSRECYIEIIRKLQPKLSMAYPTLRMPPKRGNTGISIVEIINYYIHDNISRPIRIGELSAYVGISVNHMNRIFKTECKTTVQAYIASSKIAYSCKLLRDTDRSVKDIAAYVGYDDVNYFCKVFKRHLAMTPGEYRHQII